MPMRIAPGHPASRTPTPTVVTVLHAVALSPPRGTLCGLTLTPSINHLHKEKFKNRNAV